MVGRIQFLSCVSIIHQVAAQPQEVRKVSQVIKIADSLTCWRTAVKQPTATGIAIAVYQAGRKESVLASGGLLAEYHILIVDGCEMLVRAEFFLCHNAIRLFQNMLSLSLRHTTLHIR